MPRITVSDTSCLILFHKIGETDLLKDLFGNVLITETVAKEFNKTLPDWCEVVHPSPNQSRVLSNFLDPGEATSIALASEHENSLLIIDEVKGRKIAREMGIRITGSLGVLIAAKNKGHTNAVKPILQKIRKTNFRISHELIHWVLKKTGED